MGTLQPYEGYRRLRHSHQAPLVAPGIEQASTECRESLARRQLPKVFPNAIKNPAPGGADEHQDQFVDLKKIIGCRQCMSVPSNAFIEPITVLIQYSLLKGTC